jgi:GNAT superfamily N-acetyltransferase
MTIAVNFLLPEDRAAWETLARGYKDFYKTSVSPAELEHAWNRLLRQQDVFGYAAKRDGELIGIAHYLFHKSVWAKTVCYLQDLFVVPHARGIGAGRALIAAVAGQAEQRNATRFYWCTHEQNHDARGLYEKVARFNGFIRYEYSLLHEAQESCRSIVETDAAEQRNPADSR